MMMQTKKMSSTLFTLLAAIVCAIGACQCLGVSVVMNGTAIYESAKAMDPCFAKASPSFLYPPESDLPTSPQELERTCRVQAEGMKCLKEKGKTTQYLIKRGVTSWIQSRQRYHKKYCTNVNSELSMKLVKDLKCIMDKKVGAYRKANIEFANTFAALLEERARFKDTAAELKYLCCAMIVYRKRFTDLAGPECESSKPSMEEMSASIIGSELNLVCEDEDKLLGKICPSLKPLANVSTKFDPVTDTGPSTLGIYLFATLGDSEALADPK